MNFQELKEYENLLIETAEILDVPIEHVPLSLKKLLKEIKETKEKIEALR